MSGKPLNLADAAQPPLFVPGAIPAFRLLELFKKSRTHVALVVDEYGDVEGLVTINDFFEDLVGEVASADMPQERHAVQRPDGSWLIDGKMLVHDFKELLNLGTLPGEERGSYLTLGGFVMMQIGRIPVTADRFEALGSASRWSTWMGSVSTRCWSSPCRRPKAETGRRRNPAVLVTAGGGDGGALWSGAFEAVEVEKPHRTTAHGHFTRNFLGSRACGMSHSKSVSLSRARSGCDSHHGVQPGERSMPATPTSEHAQNGSHTPKGS